MTPTCRCHCRTCESHFASLEAFDAHRSGSPNRTCTFPDDSGLTELTGKCSIADDTTRIGVCVYSTERAVRACLLRLGGRPRGAALQFQRGSMSTTPTLEEMVARNLEQAAIRLKATEDENVRLLKENESLMRQLALAESMIEEQARRP